MNDSQSERPAGWDLLFKNEAFPPRYKTFAPPNESVAEWADTIPLISFVLDVGCGVGRHVVYLGGLGFKMAGMDLSPSGVQATREVCAERAIEFDGRVADMTALPWEADTFDAALSTSTVCHHLKADIVKTIGEMFRVLKPGGSLLVDFLHKDTVSYQEVRQQAAEGKLSEVEPNTFVDDSAAPDLTDDAFLPHHYVDEAEVRELLGAFEIIRLSQDLPGRTPEGGLAKRGHWVAWARKPH